MIVAPPPVALSASPPRVVLAGASSEAIHVTNAGRSVAFVTVAPAGFALDLRGRPRVVQVRGRPLLEVRPRRLELPPRQTAVLTVSAASLRTTPPGDHAALVLLTTRPLAGNGIAVRMRLGVVVIVRVPGVLVHRVDVRAVRVRRRGVLYLSVANRGNASERIAPGRLRVTLVRRGRVLARLRTVPRELLPGTRGVVELRYPGRIRGRVAARVELTLGRRVVRRLFVLRL
jgi:hypothetical protein